MSGAPITRFAPDPERLAVLAECMENYGVGDDDAEWPNNLVSRRTVVYGSGVIARVGDVVRHAVDPDELSRCRRLAAEIATLMRGVEVGMGSESGDEFHGFFVAASAGDPPPRRIDEDLIRARFGGTIFPPATMTVEPLAEQGVWWSEVRGDYDELEERLAPWRAMTAWFRGRPEFVDAAFVRIGDANALQEVPEEDWPAGTEMTGSVLPRLALGLTRDGSLVGLFGVCVQT
jgi:hypothetical protein